MAEALPMTILYLRDNNTLVYTFKYTLSLSHPEFKLGNPELY